MSGTNQICSNALVNHTGATPSYRPLSGSGPQQMATESFSQTELKAGATFSHMSAYWSTPGTSTFVFRKNAGNGNQTFSSTGQPDGIITDSTHTDVCAANDLVDMEFTSNNFGDLYWTSIIANATNPFIIQGSGFASTGGGGLQTFPTIATFEQAMGGCLQQSTSSNSTSQALIEAAGTASYFQINITGAPSGTATLNFQKGGSPANQTIVTTGTTGVVIDTTHSDALVAGNSIDVKAVSTTAVGTYRGYAYSFLGTTSAQDWFATNGGTNTGAGPFFIAPGGGIGNAITAAQADIPLAYGATASLLRLGSQNSLGAGNLKSYINGSAGNQICSYSGTAGVVTDSTHTDAITATNTVATTITVTGSGWNMIMAGMSLNDNSNTGSHPNSFGSIAA